MMVSTWETTVVFLRFGDPGQTMTSMSPIPSTSHGVVHSSSDETESTEAIYLRYAQRLCTLAQRRINRRFQPRFEADDIIQSVFRTFFRRSNDGLFSPMNSGSVWSLLVQITLNKVCKQVEHHQAGKRSVRVEVSGDGDAWQSCLAASEPGPAEAAALTDEIDLVMSQFQGSEPQILELCLQGFPTQEIADKIGCSRWTVRRVLDRVGRLLEQRLMPET